MCNNNSRSMFLLLLIVIGCLNQNIGGNRVKGITVRAPFGVPAQELDKYVLTSSKEDKEEGIVIEANPTRAATSESPGTKFEEENQPEEQQSLAQSQPGAIALAGRGGVASSAPRGTAIVGKGGLAVSSPRATSVAGRTDTKKYVKY